MQKNDEKIKYYTAFSYLNIKPLLKSKMFEYFDYDIKKAFLASEKELAKMSSELDISIPNNYINKRNKLDIEKCYENAFKNKDVKILTYEDEKYPKLLKEIPDFPLSLFYIGSLDEIDFNYPVAIVGSRNATQNAKNALSSVIKGLFNSNVLIISGLAYGIDATAHSCALENNLKTIAVIGSGLDITYPVQNKQLYKDIIENKGAIFSEYPLGVEPKPYNFPQRNRIVVGISKGTLVAEAQIKSGAMISANFTLDYNRELMCIPGNVLNPNTSGIYKLIKDGASIVTNTNDLLNCLDWDIKAYDKEDEPTNSVEKKILNIISYEAKSFDDIAFKCDEEISVIMVALTELELKGLIKQANNKYYILK